MNGKKALVIGGSNGVGLALVYELLEAEYSEIIIADKAKPEIKHDKIEYLKVDLTDFNIGIFEKYTDIDTLIITAGFGRSTNFETIKEKEIRNSFAVNAVAPLRIIKFYYNRLQAKESFDCAVMCSIAGRVSSPLFALYGATKAALCRFIESVNVELEKSGTNNRILEISPGSIDGTRFYGNENKISELKELAQSILKNMFEKQELYIPKYETVYKDVMNRYAGNPHDFGIQSYEYKLNSNRMSNTPQLKIGYLSGTFDLFHIGHLNLLRRAKECCDYLIVGVHKDASHKGKTAYIPFEERVEILKSIKYVDEVICSKPEDIDTYDEIKYDYLFVGSDYKGTDRFNRYEEFFKDKGVKIIYFPYTKGTSSTQIRQALDASITE